MDDMFQLKRSCRTHPVNGMDHGMVAQNKHVQILHKMWQTSGVGPTLGNAADQLSSIRVDRMVR